MLIYLVLCQRRALELAEGSDGLLVVGSSLMVYSAFRLAKAAKAAGAHVVLVCVGPTRADDLADLKVPKKEICCAEPSWSVAVQT